MSFADFYHDDDNNKSHRTPSAKKTHGGRRQQNVGQQQQAEIDIFDDNNGGDNSQPNGRPPHTYRVAQENSNPPDDLNDVYYHESSLSVQGKGAAEQVSEVLALINNQIAQLDKNTKKLGTRGETKEVRQNV